MFVQANAYSAADRTRFSACRYGNVVGSRGSVVPLFLGQRPSGRLTVTDPRMTRFWLTLTEGVEFVIRCIGAMHGGEIFVPRIPSMNIMDLAKAMADGAEIDYIGIRSGEKLHEALVSEDEARHTFEWDGMYIIEPLHPWWVVEKPPGARPLPDGFSFVSDRNERFLTVDELRRLVEGA
jgi:FlaA1/EpsC-like NDP-sugar epimerase